MIGYLTKVKIAVGACIDKLSRLCDLAQVKIAIGTHNGKLSNANKDMRRRTP